MGELVISFAGRILSLRYGSEAAGRFLELLFGDLRDNGSNAPSAGVLELVARNDSTGEFALIDNGRHHADGTLGVSFAAIVFDRVIFHFLADNADGVALHAGAVASDRQVILLPGQSGAGKSTITAWLTAQGFSYLTDELVFLPATGDTIHSFVRPLNIKPGAREVVHDLITRAETSDLIADNHGMIVPHRAVNPRFRIETWYPALLLFPAYRAGADMRVERLSEPKAGMSLVTCNVNGRNLADHGFRQLMDIARATPAYRLTYGSFDRLNEEVSTLLQRHRA